jgi:hypothetical protein
MRQAPLLMDVTAEFTGECTDVLTAAPTTRVLPPIITVVLPRTITVLPRTITALGLTTVLLRIITALPPITAVPAFTLVSGSRPEARQPRNNAGAARHAAGRPCAFQHGVAELVLALLCAGAAFANAGEAIE